MCWGRGVAVGAALVLVLVSVAPWAQAVVCNDDTDDVLWDTFEACESYEGTQGFVAQCPGSARVGEARECLARWDAEAAQWERVGGCTDRGQVEGFIEKYPKGRFAEPARECLAKLQDTDVERLLAVCEMHFEANRLTTGVGGTAVGCYREVLSRDPVNVRAVQGLQRVFERYARVVSHVVS